MHSFLVQSLAERMYCQCRLPLLLQVLLLWLSDKRATLQQLLEAVEHTSAGAGTLQLLIKMAR